MNVSIQTKLLGLCIFLVLLTSVGVSATYYMLTRRDKQRESRQRIQIGIDIVLDGLTKRTKSYIVEFEEFLEADYTLHGVANLYNQDTTQIGRLSFIGAQFPRVSDELRRLGRGVSANQLALYGQDKRLLALYHQTDEKESVGMYLRSQTGQDTYIALDDSSQITSMMYGAESLPEIPLPSGVGASYEDDVPETLSNSLFRKGRQIGFRITVPLYHLEKKAGVLVGEMSYATQDIVEQYASLSKTEVNFFTGNQLSIGTFPVQATLESEFLEEIATCEELMSQQQRFEVSTMIFDKQSYYQGRCSLRNAQATLGAISVSISQEIEKKEIHKILIAVIVISGITLSVAFWLSWVFSRKTILSIHNIVSVIVAAAEGDLRRTSSVTTTHDEIGMLANKLNQMIGQLRGISRQVQSAAYTVDSTADTILEQMHDLIGHMEQQSGSVDNATLSVEKITEFIDIVARNTTDLLIAATQILSSLQETQASIEEVTTSTGSLTTNLHLISSSVEQVNHSVKQIAGSTGQLEETAQHTETEIHHIDRLLQDVSHNADRTQQLAKETMEAATSGQSSVEASLQGMTKLKTVVSDTAKIIREVSSWGDQVSSILNIVDEITEQTSLLALNASIISAQAGVHGRGFAVVADEIKELATRTKDSTKEIGTLIRELQKKTEEGVHNTADGLSKADRGMQLASAVQEALNTILERAIRSSDRAADTVQVIQKTADSSQAIGASMGNVTEMVSHIRTTIQGQEQDMGQVVLAVENISGMAEQVNRAGIEQTKTTEQIAKSMEAVTERFERISEQTEELKQNARQIVLAMHTIESTTGQTLRNASAISGDTVNNLVQQSEMLQQSIKVFKVSS